MVVKLQAYSVQTKSLIQTDFTTDLFQKQPALNSVFCEKVSDVPVLNKVVILQCTASNFMELGLDLTEEELAILMYLQENLLSVRFHLVAL